MLILRTGVDIIEIHRLADLQPAIQKRFIQRVYTPAEIELAADANPYPTFAGRFAAKEAVAKALGTGIGVIAWQEIEILRAANKEPLLKLHGKAAEIANSLYLTQWSISISHSKHYAVATATAIGEST